MSNYWDMDLDTEDFSTDPILSEFVSTTECLASTLPELPLNSIEEELVLSGLQKVTENVESLVDPRFADEIAVDGAGPSGRLFYGHHVSTNIPLEIDVNPTNYSNERESDLISTLSLQLPNNTDENLELFFKSQSAPATACEVRQQPIFASFGTDTLSRPSIPFKSNPDYPVPVAITIPCRNLGIDMQIPASAFVRHYLKGSPGEEFGGVLKCMLGVLWHHRKGLVYADRSRSKLLVPLADYVDLFDLTRFRIIPTNVKFRNESIKGQLGAPCRAHCYEACGTDIVELDFDGASHNPPLPHGKPVTGLQYLPVFRVAAILGLQLQMYTYVQKVADEIGLEYGYCLWCRTRKISYNCFVLSCCEFCGPRVSSQLPSGQNLHILAQFACQHGKFDLWWSHVPLLSIVDYGQRSGFLINFFGCRSSDDVSYHIQRLMQELENALMNHPTSEPARLLAQRYGMYVDGHDANLLKAAFIRRRKAHLRPPILRRLTSKQSKRKNLNFGAARTSLWMLEPKKHPVLQTRP